MRVQRRVRKKGRIERRDVTRRNQWLCVSDDEKVEDVSDSSPSSSSSREVERGIFGASLRLIDLIANLDERNFHDKAGILLSG